MATQQYDDDLAIELNWGNLSYYQAMAEKALITVWGSERWDGNAWVYKGVQEAVDYFNGSTNLAWYQGSHGGYIPTALKDSSGATVINVTQALVNYMGGEGGKVLKNLESFLNLKFNVVIETSANESFTIDLTRTAQNPNIGGEVSWDLINGDFKDITMYDLGTAGWLDVFVHELGHALGLAHPGNYNGSGAGTGNEGFRKILLESVDNIRNTIMTYDEYFDGVYETTTNFQELDLLALIRIFGLNSKAQQYLGATGGNDAALAAFVTNLAKNNAFLTNSNVVVNLTVNGTEGADSLSGGAGADSIYGLGGNDTLIGNDGNDYISGSDGNDLLVGGNGNDTLYSGFGNDTLNGGSGNDYLYSGPGDDLIDGGDGDDRFSHYFFWSGSEGYDTVVGGAGNDTFIFDGKMEFLDVVKNANGTFSLSMAGSKHVTMSGVEFVQDANGVKLSIDALLTPATTDYRDVTVLFNAKSGSYYFTANAAEAQVYLTGANGQKSDWSVATGLKGFESADNANGNTLHKFWHEGFQRFYYCLDQEAGQVKSNLADWQYQGATDLKVYTQAQMDQGLAPSGAVGIHSVYLHGKGHVFTSDLNEVKKLLGDDTPTWGEVTVTGVYGGIAFYGDPLG